MNIDSDDLNYLLSFVMPLEAEQKFIGILTSILDRKPIHPGSYRSPRLLLEKSRYLINRYCRINVIQNYIPTSISQATNKRDRAIAILEQTTPVSDKTIQRIWEARRQILATYAPLEREFFERIL